MSGPSNAFTLIELLVVITIIVVLLALLTPALDKAVYQAELAMCAANQHGIASGAQVYAVDYKRRYPYRPGQDGNDKSPNVLSRGAAGTRFDNRPIFKGYIPNKILVEPLAQDLDFGTTKSTFIWTDYSMWFGFTYKIPGDISDPLNPKAAGSERGMIKMGDRLTFNGREFNALLCDLDIIAVTDGNLTHVAHPAHDGRSVLKGGQDVSANEVTTGQDLPDQAEGDIATVSWWDTAGHDRGEIDFNYAMQDGSVGRYDRLPWFDAEDEGRVARVPEHPGGAGFDRTTPTGGGRWLHIPAR